MIKPAQFLEFFKKGRDFKKLLNSYKKDKTMISPIEEKKQKITVTTIAASALLATPILLAVLPAATIPSAFAEGFGGGCGTGGGSFEFCDENTGIGGGGFGGGVGEQGAGFGGGGGSGDLQCGGGVGGGLGHDVGIIPPHGGGSCEEPPDDGGGE